MAPKRKTYSKRKSHKTMYLAIGIIAILLIGIGAYIAYGQQSSQNANTTPTATPTTSPTSSASEYANATEVLLHTSMGDITIALRNDKPITSGNFINLVKEGIYNNTIFHRVIDGFMIQGGDPTGTGYGDPSIPTIPDEIGNDNINFNGTIAMANTGQPNSASSQFFINVANNNNLYPSFDTSYTVFGKVVSGMNVVMAVSHVATDSNDRPLSNVTLIGASVLPSTLT
jgi:cyclophilin family peptidyl-prolyl cis-trans isomerase